MKHEVSEFASGCSEYAVAGFCGKYKRSLLMIPSLMEDEHEADKRLPVLKHQ